MKRTKNKRGRGCSVSKDPRDNLSKEQMRTILRKIKDQLQKEYIKKYGSNWEKHWLVDNEISPPKQGKGIMDIVRKALPFLSSPRNKFNPQARKILETYANAPIKSIQVVRTPINSMVKSFLNVLSLGNFLKKKKELKYEDVFHLSLVITLADGTKLRTDKQTVPEISKSLQTTSQSQIMSVPMNKQITFGEFISNGISYLGSNAWTYDMYSNCQVYVNGMLVANKLNSEPIKKFVMQDARALVSTIPGIPRKILNVLLPVISAGDKIVRGNGRKKKGGSIVRDPMEDWVERKIAVGGGISIDDILAIYKNKPANPMHVYKRAPSPPIVMDGRGFTKEQVKKELERLSRNPPTPKGKEHEINKKIREAVKKTKKKKVGKRHSHKVSDPDEIRKLAIMNRYIIKGKH